MAQEVIPASGRRGACLRARGGRIEHRIHGNFINRAVQDDLGAVVASTYGGGWRPPLLKADTTDKVDESAIVTARVGVPTERTLSSLQVLAGGFGGID